MRRPRVLHGFGAVRGCGRIFGGFAGEACLAPTARQTFTPSPGAMSIEPVGATHALPAGVARFPGRSRVWQDFRGIRGRGMPRPYSKTNIHAIPRRDVHRTGRGDACVARGCCTVSGPFAGMAGFSGDSRARHASPLQQDKHSCHPPAATDRSLHCSGAGMHREIAW